MRDSKVLHLYTGFTPRVSALETPFMCGIIGLLIKAPALRPQLGELMVPMLSGMTQRGPDSCGLAAFTESAGESHRKISLYCGASCCDWSILECAFCESFGEARFETNGNHAILTTAADLNAVRKWVGERFPQISLLSVGRIINVYKDVGLPTEVAARYGFSNLSGTHVVGHTRMATESAVTPQNAHPYTAGEDWCLVHNGSLANARSLRRKLEKRGERFESDCDTEAACRYLHWRLRSGDTLERALQGAFDDFDGFFTFLMGTREQIALVRDPFACKPAIVAETEAYVAIASEFHALAHLPGIQRAEVFEPKPARVYSWSVQ